MIIHAVNGLVYGGLLYILAVGLTLIFGLRQIPNFAHGALFMLGAYVTYAISLRFGFGLAVVGAVLALAVLGAAIDALIFRPLQDKDHMASLLVTFGLHLLLTDFVMTAWGRNLLSVPAPAFLSGVTEIAGAPYPNYRLAVIVLAFVVAACLGAWLRFTRTGLYVRASSIDPVGTAAQGVNTNRLSMLVVALGSGLAGLAGAASAPLLTISPAMGASVLINCFIVVVTGGLASPLGAFVAALLIGQAQNIGTVYAPNFAPILPLVVMILVFAFRPGGLAGARA